MKNKENTYASFSSTNKHKSYFSVPKLEGYSNLSEGNSDIYQNIYDFLNKTVDYQQCKKENTQSCNEYQFYEIDSVEKDLDELRRKRQQAEREFTLCKNQTASCIEIYNQIVEKTKEFESLHNNLTNQRDKISNCKHKKDECDSYQSKINDLEELLKVYERELTNLKAEVKELNCENYV